MRAEEVLPKLGHHRFSLTVRIIASILVVTFLAQDIVWAHPAAFVNRSSQNDKLATESFFKQKDSVAKFYVRAIDDLIQNKLNEMIKAAKKDPDRISLDDIKEAAKTLAAEERSDWFKRNNLLCTVNDDEVLISFSPGYVIRYFKYNLDKPNLKKYGNLLHESTKPVNEYSRLY